MYNTVRPLVGNYFQGEVVVGERPVQLDNEDTDAILINIINPELNNDGTVNTVDVYYGDRNRQRNKLLPLTSTGLLPISAGSTIWLRAKHRDADGTGLTRTVIVYELFS